MDSIENVLVDSFKSKKILHSDMKPSPSPSGKKPLRRHHELNQCCTKTPDKPIDPPRRTRNRGAALSIKEVKEAARKLRLGPGPIDKPDPLVASIEEQIPFSPVTKPKKKKPVDSDKIPERYDVLVEVFHSLESSIRLCRMKGSMTTFTNLSFKIKSLADRSLTHSHLAQIKFILPEAFQIKKTLILDEHTSCMKPELLIDLDAKAIEESKIKVQLENGSDLLRKIFRSRLVDYYKAHPEGDEIPEAELPEPFNASKRAVETKATFQESSMVNETLETAPPEEIQEKPPILSHVPSSVRKSFLGKAIPRVPKEGAVASVATFQGSLFVTETLETASPEEIQEKPPMLSHIRRTFSQKAIPMVPKEGAVASGSQSLISGSSFSRTNLKDKCSIFETASPRKLSSNATKDVGTQDEVSSACLQCSLPFASPVKNSNSDLISNPSAGIHVQCDSTPAKLKSATPMLAPPKRCFMTPENDTTTPANKLVRRRTLNFDATPLKNAKVEDDDDEEDCFSVDDDVLDVLPKSLIRSIKEKEMKALLEQDPAISQAKRRKQMLASLPKLFDMIYFLFQSIRRSVLTKAELMHKIITCNLDIVDKKEVEEQLRLLQEYAPEWIYEKLAASGDCLLCVNKLSSPESIRSRLAEAM